MTEGRTRVRLKACALFVFRLLAENAVGVSTGNRAAGIFPCAVARTNPMWTAVPKLLLPRTRAGRAPLQFGSRWDGLKSLTTYRVTRLFL